MDEDIIIDDIINIKIQMIRNEKHEHKYNLQIIDIQDDSVIFDGGFYTKERLKGKLLNEIESNLFSKF